MSLIIYFLLLNIFYSSFIIGFKRRQVLHEVYILKQGTYIHFCSSVGTAVSQLSFRTYLDVIVSGNTPGKICRKLMLISQPKVSVSLLECVLISDDKYFLLFNLPKLKKIYILFPEPEACIFTKTQRCS